MAHDLTDTFTRALLEDERTVFPLVLLELTHPDISPPIRVANDFTPLDEDEPLQPNVPYFYGNKLWQAFPFDVSLVNNSAGIPEAKLRIQNVDRRIGQALLAISDPIRISVTVLSSADFELNLAGTRMVEVSSAVVQRFWPLAYLMNVSWDRREVTADVKGFDISLEPFPYQRATVARTPALWM